MTPLSTEEVAKSLGIGRGTLERWLREGKVPKPKPLRVGRKLFRLWTDRDIDRVKQYKEKFYRKGRGRKRKPKA